MNVPLPLQHCLYLHSFILTNSKSSIHTSLEFGAKDPDFGRYKLQKVHRWFNRLFGACFVDKNEYKVPQISPLEVLLKPNERRGSGRTFNRSDFHADRKHDPHASLEELGNTLYHPTLSTHNIISLQLTHQINAPFYPPICYTPLSRTWMCRRVLRSPDPSRGALQHYEFCTIVL